MGSEGCVNELQVPSDLQATRRLEEDILDRLAQFGYPEQSVFAVKLALEEALVNAIKHGNGSDPSKQVTVRYDVNAERVEIVVVDEGSGFCPMSVPDCTADENLCRPCGRGIMLMRAYMDQVQYSENGTTVRMVKYNRAKA